MYNAIPGSPLNPHPASLWDFRTFISNCCTFPFISNEENWTVWKPEEKEEVEHRTVESELLKVWWWGSLLVTLALTIVTENKTLHLVRRSIFTINVVFMKILLVGREKKSFVSYNSLLYTLTWTSRASERIIVDDVCDFLYGSFYQV